jgi:hypothetical protein
MHPDSKVRSGHSGNEKHRGLDAILQTAFPSFEGNIGATRTRFGHTPIIRSGNNPYSLPFFEGFESCL